jgi:hypothetical protein
LFRCPAPPRSSPSCALCARSPTQVLDEVASRRSPTPLVGAAGANQPHGGGGGGGGGGELLSTDTQLASALARARAYAGAKDAETRRAARLAALRAAVDDCRRTRNGDTLRGALDEASLSSAAAVGAAAAVVGDGDAADDPAVRALRAEAEALLAELDAAAALAAAARETAAIAAMAEEAAVDHGTDGVQVRVGRSERASVSIAGVVVGLFVFVVVVVVVVVVVDCVVAVVACLFHRCGRCCCCWWWCCCCWWWWSWWWRAGGSGGGGGGGGGGIFSRRLPRVRGRNLCRWRTRQIWLPSATA